MIRGYLKHLVKLAVPTNKYFNSSGPNTLRVDFINRRKVAGARRSVKNFPLASNSTAKFAQDVSSNLPSLCAVRQTLLAKKRFEFFGKKKSAGENVD